MGTTAYIGSMTKKREQGTWTLRSTRMAGDLGGRQSCRPAANAAVLLTRDAAKQDAAWKFLSFAAGPVGQTIMVRGTGYVPSNTLTLNDDRYLGAFYRDSPLFRPAMEQIPIMQPWFAFPGSNGVRITQTIVDNLARIVEQRATPEQVLADVTDGVQKLFAAGLGSVGPGWRRPGPVRPRYPVNVTSIYSSARGISIPISGMRSIASAPDRKSATQSSPFREKTVAPAWVCCSTTYRWMDAVARYSAFLITRSSFALPSLRTSNTTTGSWTTVVRGGIGVHATKSFRVADAPGCRDLELAAMRLACLSAQPAGQGKQNIALNGRVRGGPPGHQKQAGKPSNSYRGSCRSSQARNCSIVIGVRRAMFIARR